MNGTGNTMHIGPETAPRFISDDELRERDTPELDIDWLDRMVETQKMANGSRDRAAVEAALAERQRAST